MRRNNKGYSFVELIITMAIFSIIMLAIILMMRTSLVSYKDSLFETTMQEEAQIVANQVGDLLVDATRIDGSISPTATSYAFYGPVDAGGAIKRFTLDLQTIEDDETHEVITRKLWYNGVDNQLLSDKISSFSISGLERHEDGETEVFDNSATVIVEIEYQGRSYKAEKDVYFRNNIENILSDSNSYDPYDVGSSNVSIPSPTPSGLKTAEIKRYKAYDISAEYDIIAGAVLYENNTAVTNGQGSVFKLIAGTDPNTNGTIKSTPTGMSASDLHHYTIEVTDTYLSDTGLALGTPTNSEAYYVTGKNSKNQDVKVLLSLEPVSMVNGAQVFEARTNTDEMKANGYVTCIEVKGIDINEALSAGENAKKVTYTAEIYSNGTSKCKYTNKSVKALSTAYAKDIIDSGNTYTPDVPSTDPPKFELCIAPDPINGGLVFTGGKNSGGNTNAGNNNKYNWLLSNAGNKNELQITFKIGDSYVLPTLHYQFVFADGTLN